MIKSITGRVVHGPDGKPLGISDSVANCPTIGEMEARINPCPLYQDGQHCYDTVFITERWEGPGDIVLAIARPPAKSVLNGKRCACGNFVAAKRRKHMVPAGEEKR